MKATIATLLAAAVMARAQVATTSEPALAQITTAAATTKPESPVSNVKGLAFDRFYQVWLENIVSDAFPCFWAAFVNIHLGLRGCRSRLQHAVASSPGYSAVSSQLSLIAYGNAF